jgi:glycopeptide antibiotics resistance protein
VFKKIQPDKWRHFIAGIVLGVVLQALGWWLLPLHFATATALAFVLVIAISYGFELFSKITGHGYYEIMDAVASVAGGVLGIGIILLFQFI